MSNTKDQDLAITSIGDNIAVNAGAGTGKTKVLTERYVYILEEGKLEEGREIESIVAITFTKKATQEMKERIREKIKDRFPQNNKWRRYYKDMEKANISTIHSFCSRILRENALEANIDPMFEVLDEYEGDLLLGEAILNTLSKGIEEDDNIYDMVKVFNRDNLADVVEELKDIYSKIREGGYCFENVRDMTLNAIDSIEIDLDGKKYIQNTFTILMEKARKNSKIYKLKDDKIWLDFCSNSHDEEELIPILEYLYDNIGQNAKEKETIENLKDKIQQFFLIKEKRKRWLYKAILDSLVAIDIEYSKMKSSAGVLDYDDLQILLLKLFDDEKIKEKYQNKFRYIMVDEFQDTNELQKKIFYKLCSKDNTLDRSNLFIVGDPKQSIYGFRGADLDVFYDVIDDIEKVSGNPVITLDINFRTVNTVLTVLNGLFQKLMDDRYTSLTHHYKSQNHIDVEILEKEDLQIPENVKPSDYCRYYESRLIASRIEELVDEGGFEYGDFALLFRSTPGIRIYKDALREYNIPYYNISGKGFYGNQEIVDIINALKAISNRYDTIPMVGFLRSPMIGVSDGAIYWLLRNRKDTLLETMDMDIPYIDKKDRDNIRKAKGILDELIVKKDLYGVHLLIREIIKETLYIETMLLYKDGKQAVANIYKFIEIARNFDKTIIGSLEDFIDYIDGLEGVDEAQAKIESENANVVKLITIHKSKGLQFPAVIIPQMSRKFNDSHPRTLFDKERGIGFKYDDKSIFYKDIRKDISAKEDEENQRILYVAMTRAKKKLIIGNQGANRGFKAMIKGLIDEDKINIINHINRPKTSEESLKLISRDLFKAKPFDDEIFPLTKKVPGYNQKSFANFSISQYMEFRQCKRRFFMKYYKNLPLGEIDIYENKEKDPSNPKRLAPITKGNIVHEFCEHYRYGIETKELLEDIIESFGLEYNLNIEKELDPYITNYLKYYKEDYSDFYIEKDFYLKLGNNYINGVIDRVNIRNGKAEIVDFKTNRVYNKEYLLNIYKPQLQLYAYAFQKISGIEVRSAGILFLETGELEDINISKEELENNIKDIGNFIDFVTEHSSIKHYDRSEDCEENCQYSRLCSLSKD